MKVQILDRIISVHKNTTERLSKISPYILIGASITGTLLILHIHKLWKNSKLRFSEYCLSWFRRLPPPLPPPPEQQQRQNAPKRELLIRPIQHAQTISELPPTNGTGGTEEAASIAGTGRIGTLSVLSDDSFISACDEFIPTNEDRDISVSTDFSVLALYNEGLKAGERGEVVYRKSRAEICGCDSEQDFVAKLYCIRLAFRRIMDDAQTMQKLMRTGRAIMADLLRHDKRDPADFYAAYDSMIAYLNDEQNLETTKEELRARKVESTNLWDVLFDLIILDAFEDLQRPPSSISALIRNSYMSRSMKESTLNNLIWSMIKMKRARLQFKDGFISHFYDISQILTSSLAMGLFGGSTREYQELCIYFKEQIFGFILEIYNPNRVRFTTVSELAEDIAKLMLERVELLQVKLSNELLPI